MKRLIIMRHASADKEHTGPDSSRPLTSDGKKTQKEMGELLKKKEIKIGEIYHSPFLRAKESAEILSSFFPDAKLINEPALGDNFDSFELLKKIEKKKFETTLLVGHEPSLALLASHLMKEHKSFKLEKSSMLSFEFDHEIKLGEGKLKFYLSPEALK